MILPHLIVAYFSEIRNPIAPAFSQKPIRVIHNKDQQVRVSTEPLRVPRWQNMGEVDSVDFDNIEIRVSLTHLIAVYLSEFHNPIAPACSHEPFCAIDLKNASRFSHVVSL